MSETDKQKLVVALDAGPRKKWNTSLLLEEALKGAKDEGARTDYIRLYDLNYKGCASCFSCKRKESYDGGRCVLKDDLSDVLTLLTKATGVLMGSPIYLSDVTAAFRAFFERYVFINYAYERERPSLLRKGPGFGLIYTMNQPAEGAASRRYDVIFDLHTMYLKLMNGPILERIISYDTLQFKDYEKYHAPMFDPAHKKKRREEEFPKDLSRAYELWKSLGKLSELPELYKRA
jgi:multimeric flavodoxin WrbA